MTQCTPGTLRVKRSMVHFLRVPLVLAVHGRCAIAVKVRCVMLLGVVPQAALQVVVVALRRKGVAQPREWWQLQEPARKAHELTGRESVVLVRQPRSKDARAEVC